MICHRCGATVPEELPICGSCGQDLTILRDTQPGDVFGGDTDRTTEVSGLSGPLRLRDTGFAGRQQGLPYTTGDVVIDRYQIDDVIAEGPVGVVYSAVDLDMDVQIALKVILAEYFPDPKALARFSRAMAPAADMNHGNIVRLYDLAPDESRYLVPQRLVMGRTLSEVLAGRLPQGIPSPADEVRAILSQIGEALAYAHPDIPHTALKPTNVLILPAGLLLTDFCLAGAIDRNAYLAGHRHRRLPTRYLAPELLAGQRFDHRVDLYSLAVIGFELLTGTPVPEDPDRRETALAAIPAVSRATLAAALSASPSQRPRDADELVEALLAATEEDTAGIPDQASLSVGDTTNVLDLNDVEVLDEEEDVPLEADYAAEDESTDPTAGQSRARTRDPDTLVKQPSRDAWPAAAIRTHDIPVAEPSTDEFRRVDPAALIGHHDPENFIEAAEDLRHVPDIDLDGRPERGPARALRPKGPPPARTAKVKDAIEEMDFEASLEDALASAARLPPPANRPRKRGPGYDPDPDAMRDRPVAAAGVTLAASQSSKLHLPMTSEPAVSVEPQAVPAREGTAQIPIPERPRSRAALWIGLAIFAVLCVGGTVGFIVHKRVQDQKAAEEASRRRARLRALALARQAMQADPNPTAGGMVGAMALPLPGNPSAGSPSVAARWRGGCPVTAVRLKNRRRRIDFCIDRYEHPGTRGVVPSTALEVEDAARRCRAQGKRLCTRAEWQWACGGKRQRLFSYGNDFKRGACATAGPGNQQLPVAPTGSHPRCRTPEGVYDLNGNVAEWIESSQLLGGSAGKPGAQTSCQSDTGAGGSAYYGIRCCATPRSP